jgi:hypothetical protein
MCYLALFANAHPYICGMAITLVAFPIDFIGLFSNCIGWCICRRVSLLIFHTILSEPAFGGCMQMREPAADLAIAVAIVSGYYGKSVPRDMVVIGEVRWMTYCLSQIEPHTYLLCAGLMLTLLNRHRFRQENAC